MKTSRKPSSDYKPVPHIAFRSTKPTIKVKMSPTLDSVFEKNAALISKPDKIELNDYELIDQVPICPVYYPTKEEFEDPFLYIRSISTEASKYGMCKIVSPLTSSVPAGVVLKKEAKDFKFTTKVQPLRLPSKNSNNQVKFYMRGRHYTFRDFQTMADKVFARKYSVSGCLPPKYLERELWREMARGKKGTVEYGADLDATAFSCDPSDLLGRSKWNLKVLPFLPNSVLRLLECGIPGVTDPMLYIGMLFSMFAWHVEDHYLYSMSYLHCGAPKTWYGVPSSAALEFEQVIENYVYDKDILTSDGKPGALKVLLERTTMFPPTVLMKLGVPVYKAVHFPGEFMINFPRSYHAGFNQGFNCSEAVNFAFGDWFRFGAEATRCYALFGKTPVVPYEELLCKEATLLTKSLDHRNDAHWDSLSAYCIKTTFAPLIRSYEHAREKLKELGADVRFSPDSDGMYFCRLCQRGCYVAYFMCSCHEDPTCLFHDIESYECLYQSKCTLFIRRDLFELEAVAKKFEHEDGIRKIVEENIKRESDMSTQSSVPSMADEFKDSKSDIVENKATLAPFKNYYKRKRSATKQGPRKM